VVILTFENLKTSKFQVQVDGRWTLGRSEIAIRVIVRHTIAALFRYAQLLIVRIQSLFLGRYNSSEQQRRRPAPAILGHSIYTGLQCCDHDRDSQ
jgi:hypothetical protein